MNSLNTSNSIHKKVKQIAFASILSALPFTDAVATCIQGNWISIWCIKQNNKCLNCGPKKNYNWGPIDFQAQIRWWTYTDNNGGLYQSKNIPSKKYIIGNTDYQAPEKYTLTGKEKGELRKYIQNNIYIDNNFNKHGTDENWFMLSNSIGIIEERWKAYSHRLDWRDKKNYDNYTPLDKLSIVIEEIMHEMVIEKDYYYKERDHQFIFYTKDHAWRSDKKYSFKVKGISNDDFDIFYSKLLEKTLGNE